MAAETFLNSMNESFSKEGQDLVNKFFIVFSRFECALKASGFAHGNNERVLANWDTFAALIRESFEEADKSDQLQAAIEYLLNHPPRIQNYLNEELGWRDRIFNENQPIINKLSLSIRDIRNNLFHGGKFNGKYQEDISRNFILLKGAIEILNKWLELNETVRLNFLKPIS